jgi:hypothetical protein
MIVPHWIEYPTEPRELLLVWQAPLSARISDRLRWAVGRLEKTESGAVFDYLDSEDFARLNLGRSMADLRDAGYAGYPAFDAKRRDEGGFREQVVEAFLRRLPPSTRPDFGAYLVHFHIKPAVRLSPFALLAVTEARLPSDGFSLVDPLDPDVQCVDLVFEIAGFRHIPDRPSLRPDQPLELEVAADNLKDPNALAVKADGRLIGYANRLQAQTIGAWLQQRSIECWVSRVHFRGDTPRAYAFLQVRPTEQSIAAWSC